MEELFARRTVAKPPKGHKTLSGEADYTYPTALELMLACGDELVLEVEA